MGGRDPVHSSVEALMHLGLVFVRAVVRTGPEVRHTRRTRPPSSDDMEEGTFRSHD